ncbi:Alanine racemase [Caenispirillum salinarum AK4]|uniref:Alanine racemase n=1 Tax=Caenispirillum salinarum AK4 TaxID=1238182 RepID=K9H5L3_9PROT|nr:alanine racemase [Caenispirillum salinarum]EKV32389.1 Alanine racemase [Caenispirillum salinarum AK4]
MSSACTACAVLTIDLDALAANWRLLNARMAEAGGECAGVVKGDGYGLGLAPVACTLHAAGCRTFFVAQIDEGVRLRAVLGGAVPVYVLCGLLPGTAEVFAEHELAPVLSTPEQIAEYRRLPQAMRARMPRPAVHFDTGMRRLGLTVAEAEAFLDDNDAVSDVDPAVVVTHLACADMPAHALNAEQNALFRRLRDRLPGARGSYANSSGLFLGADSFFDLGRPGVALYGVNPTPGRPNPMHTVVRLSAPILQVRKIDGPESVGYGASHVMGAGSRVATVGVGYADGYPRALSNRGHGALGAWRVPVVGRVSMDLTLFDVSAVPEHEARPGAMIDLIGPLIPIDEVAADAGTIGYEILTQLGSRYQRVYTGGPEGAAA